VIGCKSWKIGRLQVNFYTKPANISKGVQWNQRTWRDQ